MRTPQVESTKTTAIAATEPGSRAGGGVGVVRPQRVEKRVDDLLVGVVFGQLVSPGHANHLGEVKVGVREGQQGEVILAGGQSGGEDEGVEAPAGL